MRWLTVMLIICFWVCKVKKTVGESFVSIHDVTSSDVKITWNTPHINMAAERGAFSVEFHSVDELYTPETLERNESSIYSYFTKPAQALPPDVGRWGKSPIWLEVVSDTSIEISIKGLKYPNTLYSFNLSRTLGGMTENITVLARTKRVPPYTVKLGVGSFYVFENNVEEGKRKVKIFWPVKINSNQQYLVRVYLENYAKLVRMTEIPSKEGFLMLDISLKVHLVEIRLTKGEWIADVYAQLIIPAQENILPALSSNVRSEGLGDRICTTMEWAEPKNIGVSNYTVFWLDTPDLSTHPRILDSVYVCHDIRKFQVCSNHTLFLAFSVNTESTSSGMQLPRYGRY